MGMITFNKEIKITWVKRKKINSQAKNNRLVCRYVSVMS
jgi:hypothetical protein